MSAAESESAPTPAASEPAAPGAETVRIPEVAVTLPDSVVAPLIGAGANVYILTNELTASMREKLGTSWPLLQDSLNSRYARLLAGGVVASLAAIIVWKVIRRLCNPKPKEQQTCPAGEEEVTCPWQEAKTFHVTPVSEAGIKGRGPRPEGESACPGPLHALPHKIQLRLAETPTPKDLDQLCKARDPATRHRHTRLRPQPGPEEAGGRLPCGDTACQQPPLPLRDCCSCPGSPEQPRLLYSLRESRVVQRAMDMPDPGLLNVLTYASCPSASLRAAMGVHAQPDPDLACLHPHDPAPWPLVWEGSAPPRQCPMQGDVPSAVVGREAMDPSSLLCQQAAEGTDGDDKGMPGMDSDRGPDGHSVDDLEEPPSPGRQDTSGELDSQLEVGGQCPLHSHHHHHHQQQQQQLPSPACHHCPSPSCHPVPRPLPHPYDPALMQDLAYQQRQMGRGWCPPVARHPRPQAAYAQPGGTKQGLVGHKPVMRVVQQSPVVQQPSDTSLSINTSDPWEGRACRDGGGVVSLQPEGGALVQHDAGYSPRRSLLPALPPASSSATPRAIADSPQADFPWRGPDSPYGPRPTPVYLMGYQPPFSPQPHPHPHQHYPPHHHHHPHQQWSQPSPWSGPQMTVPSAPGHFMSSPGGVFAPYPPGVYMTSPGGGVYGTSSPVAHNPNLMYQPFLYHPSGMPDSKPMAFSTNFNLSNSNHSDMLRQPDGRTTPVTPFRPAESGNVTRTGSEHSFVASTDNVGVHLEEKQAGKMRDDAKNSSEVCKAAAQDEGVFPSSILNAQFALNPLNESQTLSEGATPGAGTTPSLNDDGEVTADENQNVTEKVANELATDMTPSTENGKSPAEGVAEVVNSIAREMVSAEQSGEARLSDNLPVREPSTQTIDLSTVCSLAAQLTQVSNAQAVPEACEGVQQATTGPPPDSNTDTYGDGAETQL